MDGRDGGEPVGDETAGPTLPDGGTDPLDDPADGGNDGGGSDEGPTGAGEGPAGADEGAPAADSGEGGSPDPEGSGEAEGATDDGEEQPAPEEAEGGLPLTRRQALFGAGGLSVVGIGLGASHVLRPAQAVAPGVPSEALESNGWIRVDAVEEPVLQDSAGPITIEAVASTVQYRNQGLVSDVRNGDVTVEYAGDTQTERLGDYTGGQFDQPMGVFVATKVDVTPHVDELPAGIGRAQVMGPVRTQASDQFERRLREAGLQDVREVEPTASFEPDSGAPATQFEFRGAVTFEQTSVDVQGVPITMPGGAIEIAGYLATWHDGTNVVVAAGAHPSQNYTDTVTETVAGRDLTIGMDLGLRPAELREEVLGYMAAVE